MDRLEYHQTQRFRKKVSMKTGRSNSHEWIIIFERFDNDTCFKIVWQKTGPGGNSKEHSVTKISLEEFNEIEQ